MRFCQALATALLRHVGAEPDVRAGDIDAGGREVGFIAGAVNKLTHREAKCLMW